LVSSNSRDRVRKEILDLVGQGHSAAEIELHLGSQATQKDVEYATILVRVRDSFRADKVATDPRPASSST
jgi:hypothetical protein